MRLSPLVLSLKWFSVPIPYNRWEKWTFGETKIGRGYRTATRILSLFHIVQRKSHMNWPGIESESPRFLCMRVSFMIVYFISFSRRGSFHIYVYIVTCQPIVGLRNRALLGIRPVNKISAQTRWRHATVLEYGSYATCRDDDTRQQE
jgi:hypothetical protein